MNNLISVFVRITSLVCLVGLFGCSKITSPQFKAVENLKNTLTNRNIMQLEANAVFHNPNSYGLNMTGATLNLMVNKKLLAVIEQQGKIRITGNSDFKVPLKASVSVDNFSDLALKNMGSILSGKPLLVEFKGNLKIKRMGIAQSIPVNYSQEVSANFFSPF